MDKANLFVDQFAVALSDGTVELVSLSETELFLVGGGVGEIAVG